MLVRDPAHQRLRSGIYKITNKIDKKMYIGMANNIQSRWATHRKQLVGGYHENIFLQKAVIQDGISSFLFEIIELCPKVDLRKREQHYLDTLSPFAELGYNIHRGYYIEGEDDL